jgi:GrpB-like predicted nucleotidyltransferase (UPF0157 family)
MKIESVIEPNERILNLQTETIKEVENILSNHNVSAVGGMAVPMTGRPELDILVISEDIEGDADKLENKGFMYRTPSSNSIFLKKKVDNVEIAIEITTLDNPRIESHNKIIDLMRNDSDLRRQYEEFKRTLNGLSREEYKIKKIEWMKKNLLPKLD